MEEQVKTILFARWLPTCYSSGILMRENSYWYKEQLEHFNKAVYPNYIKNGTVAEHIKLFKTSKIVRDAINDLP